MSINGRLCFASSIAALVAHPHYSKRPYWPAVSHYLTTFRLTLNRTTLFAGIQQLLPGESLRWKSGRIHIERYWDYPEESDTPPDYEEAVQQFRDELETAVGSRLASDVPVGMFLSGGVDSNTIAAIINQTQPRTRTIGLCGGGASQQPGETNDDFHYARMCADYVGFDFEEVHVRSEDYWDCWNRLLDEYATPLSTPTDVIIYRLSQQARKSAGVVLGGEGADELLCGYAVPHAAGADFDRLRSMQNGDATDSAAAQAEFMAGLREQYGRDDFDNPTDHFFALNSLIPSAWKSRLFQPWVWNEIDEDACMRAAYSQWFDDETPTSRQQMRLLHQVNLEGLLGRLDSATMSAGLEARVPFTDHRLVETAFRFPHNYRIDIAPHEQKPYLSSLALERRGSLRSKRVLRSVADGLLPADLARRKKASFPTPVEHWMSHEWSGRLRERLMESEFGRVIFRPHAAAELADNLPAVGMRLWPVINLLNWGDRQFFGCTS